MTRTVFSCPAFRSPGLVRLLFLVFTGFYLVPMFWLFARVHRRDLPTQYYETTSAKSHPVSYILLELNATATSAVGSANVSGTFTKYNVCAMASGQLGNLMFAYASLVGIAHRNNREPHFPTSSKLAQTFSTLSYQRNTDCSQYQIVYEDHYATYDPKFEKLPETNVFLLQYFQSWKYFYFIKDVILKEFTFLESVKNAAMEMLAQCTKGHEGKAKVGVHVRRGDRMAAVHVQNGYQVAPIEYLLKAMTYLREKHKNVVFIIVSDSLDWCKEGFANMTDVVIAPGGSAQLHLALLASCDHVIMTVGTFGWWGGFLAGGDVVYYMSFDPKIRNATIIDIVHPEDHYLPHWIPIRD